MGGGGPMPTQQWMRRMRRVLEHPDAAGEAVLPLLHQMSAWFNGGDQLVDVVKRLVVGQGLQSGLVAMVQRGVAEGTETVGGFRRADLTVAVLACRVIGLSAKGYPEGAASF